MSGKAGTSGDGSHGPALIEGVTTALSWLTVLPFRGANSFDRITGARAMAALPVAGLALGALSAPLALLPTHPFVIAVLAVVVWELGSRMMHIDGLADVGDALGSYAPAERAQEILGDRYTGALGMGAVLLTLLAQVAGIMASLPTLGWVALVFLPLLGRACALIGCHTSFQPFSPSGFGSLIIGTVKTWWILTWLLVISGLAFVASDFTFAVLLAAAVAASASVVFAKHCNKRFAGLNGDTTGALIEVSIAVAAIVLAVVPV
ncbi:cobalamin synthase [Corynebacterium kalinowskii]|uniref:Adenosylcobinamide-GDP ribazoletransferase n=1 Tax=Corynebacterium kalinowskii TaxID=2675216 RepID=A0A6B8V9A5_9CORY|nr:adenosylcobinamide-GDP ribazoletransferase [Corynebacterium kalinowskii]QGU01682.1 cobalamin synthase [Corynebacterium kalinowskii]